jgi:hypothetical protein
VWQVITLEPKCLHATLNDGIGVAIPLLLKDSLNLVVKLSCVIIDSI